MKVLLLFGGNSSENKVSRKSAKSIIQNIDEDIFELTSVYIDYNNKWYLFNDLINIDNNTWIKENLEIKNIIEFIKQFDIVFPIIHGYSGEDGKLQGMLELFSIPFVGCDTIVSANLMDKAFSKIIFEHYNIKQTPYLIINRKYNYLKITKNLKFPMIIKPANGGSSIGISKANNTKELIKGIKKAFKYDRKIVIEEFIKARELECAVLKKNNKLIMNIGEILNNKEFYDYNAKYINETVTTTNPILNKKVKKQIKKISKKIFTQLDCKVLARIDFLYDDDNEILYLNEINTLPGFTEISMYPKLLTSNNITYKNLITSIIKSSLN
ncbi:MAG: D-alanine--D-alanine ligase [Firmicutes bacterium]|nr:D-alanine--D-alanine ligase [Bacillota bacterium]